MRLTVKRTVLILLGAVILIAVIFGLEYRAGRTERELKSLLATPTFGRTHKFWLSADAKSEIRSMGTNAVPILLSELRRMRGGSVMERLVSNPRVPDFIRRRLFARSYMADQEYETHIVNAFSVLGPLAGNAVPELVTLLHDPDRGTSDAARFSLMALGPSAKGALPELLRIATGPDKYAGGLARTAVERIDPETANKLNNGGSP